MKNLLLNNIPWVIAYLAVTFGLFLFAPMIGFSFFTVSTLWMLCMYLILKKSKNQVKRKENHERKIDLLAKFFYGNGIRHEDDPDLDKLLELDDLKNEVYQNNRRQSFELAAIKANKAVIEKVLNES